MASSSPRVAASLRELESIRLAHDWTWRELSEAMAAAQAAVHQRTLHYLIKASPDTAEPNDRTRHKIDRFLRYMRPREKRRARRKAAAAAKHEQTAVAG